jgi:hypothetical protein
MLKSVIRGITKDFWITFVINVRSKIYPIMKIVANIMAIFAKDKLLESKT